MKPNKDKILPKYEYVTLIIRHEQVEGYYLTKSPYEGQPYGCYDFNDIKFYINNKFTNYDAFKYHEKLDMKTFGDVLTFINKLGGWYVSLITPIVESTSSTNISTTKFIYTFERSV